MTGDPLGVLRQHVEQRTTARALELRRADLRGAELGRLRADGLDLEEADLRGAMLASARWTACKLCSARLDEANFTEARLRMCDLDGATANKARFAQARIENGTARGAKLEDADLRDAVLTDTDFSRASLRRANLERAHATGVNLRGADLTGANLSDADLTGADLRGADLTGANLDGTVLHSADLRGAIGAPAEPPEPEDEAAPMVPPGWQPLAAAVTPIVTEILQSSARRGAIDPETAARLAQQLPSSTRPGHPLPLATINAVSRVLDQLGGDVLPTLIAAMRQSEGEPPAKVMELIRRLGEELGAPAGGTVDDILARMRGT
jgi:uncharacterized protein YjbI with pentapeptide repeats